MIMFTPEAIRELRKTLRLTMKELGVRVGVTEATVSRWEAGERHPRFKQIVTLNELADSRKRVRR